MPFGDWITWVTGFGPAGTPRNQTPSKCTQTVDLYTYFLNPQLTDFQTDVKGGLQWEFGICKRLAFVAFRRPESPLDIVSCGLNAFQYMTEDNNFVLSGPLTCSNLQTIWFWSPLVFFLHIFEDSCKVDL